MARLNSIISTALLPLFILAGSAYAKNASPEINSISQRKEMTLGRNDGVECNIIYSITNKRYWIHHYRCTNSDEIFNFDGDSNADKVCIGRLNKCFSYGNNNQEICFTDINECIPINEVKEVYPKLLKEAGKEINSGGGLYEAVRKRDILRYDYP